MRLIHADNPRLWMGFGGPGPSTVKVWGCVTKYDDGHFAITPEDKEDLRKQVAGIAWEGFNGIRLLPYAGWMPDGSMQDHHIAFTPYKLDGEKWNLDWDNQDYWRIIGEIADVYKEFNIEMWYCLFDNCQFWHNPAWACWGNNVQGVDNYMADPVRSARHVARAVLELGTRGNVGFELINEGAEWGGMETSKNWIRSMFQTLKDGGVPTENVSVGVNLDRWPYIGDMKFQGGTHLQEWCKSLAGEVWGGATELSVYLPVHSVLDAPGMPAPELIFGQFFHEADYFWGNPVTARKYYLSNDGNKVKDGPEAQALWNQMVAYCTSSGAKFHSPAVGYKMVFEFLSESADPAVYLPGLRAIVSAMPNWVPVVNYHKKEYVPPVPTECKMGDVKNGTCWDGSTIVTHTCEGGKWVPTMNTCPALPPSKPPFDIKGWLNNHWYLGLLPIVAIIVLLIILF